MMMIKLKCSFEKTRSDWYIWYDVSSACILQKQNCNMVSSRKKIGLGMTGGNNLTSRAHCRKIFKGRPELPRYQLVLRTTKVNSYKLKMRGKIRWWCMLCSWLMEESPEQKYGWVSSSLNKGMDSRAWVILTGLMDVISGTSQCWIYMAESFWSLQKKKLLKTIVPRLMQVWLVIYALVLTIVTYYTPPCIFQALKRRLPRLATFIPQKSTAAVPDFCNGFPTLYNPFGSIYLFFAYSIYHY